MIKPCGFFQYDLFLQQANAWSQTVDLMADADLFGNKLAPNIVRTSAVGAQNYFNVGGPPIAAIFSQYFIDGTNANGQRAITQSPILITGNGSVITALTVQTFTWAAPANDVEIHGTMNVIVWNEAAMAV